MKKSIQLILSLILSLGLASGIYAQCSDNPIQNPGFESGMSDWWSWHDNNPDAYAFGLSNDAFTGDSSAVISVLVNSADLTAFQGAEYNNRPQTIPLEAGKEYTLSFAGKSTVQNTNVSVWVKDENDGWFTLHNETLTIDTSWTMVSTTFVADKDRADIHVELKVYNENFDPYTVQLDDVALCDVSANSSTCEGNVVANPGFEDGNGVDWWNWHGGHAEAYGFGNSDDAFFGDSSAVINVLLPSSQVTGVGEYNSRPQVSPVVGGEFYQINFAAKSTEPNTNIQVWVKDENDSWITLYNETITIGTEWAEYSTFFQADEDRADIHIELKVFNESFENPYTVFFDEVAICNFDPTTATCSGNLVSNPGFESGADVDWWTWHGGNETDYSFETSSESFVGDQSALIRVLKPSAELSGTGEYNSRPQVSALVAEQNYEVSLVGKSTVDNTVIQVWVKDEFDGWTTIGNDEITVGTDWTEGSFIFTADTDRADVHVELKVFNADFTEAYDVWIDEVAICATDENPDDPNEQGPSLIFGSADSLVSCSTNMALEFAETDIDGDGVDWEVWDGSDDEVLSTWSFDPVFPYSGNNSIRVDIMADHNVAELHHRFGQRFNLVDGETYTITFWMRVDVPEGDTVRIYGRAVRDTDWQEPSHGNFIATKNEWLNFSHTFTPDGDWNNAFLELKCQRWNDGFTSAYSVWVDEVQICGAEDVVITTDVNDLQALGLNFSLFPNPSSANTSVSLKVDSPMLLKNTSIQLFDLLGRKLLQKEVDIHIGAQDIHLPTRHLPAGMYIIHVQHSDYFTDLKLQVFDRP